MIIAGVMAFTILLSVVCFGGQTSRAATLDVDETDLGLDENAFDEMDMLTEEQAKDIDSCCEYAANSQIKDVVLLKNMSADINNSVTVIDAATKKEQQLRLAEILGGKLS